MTCGKQSEEFNLLPDGRMKMSECQICHCEDATVLEFCEDCYDEMKIEADYSGQDFHEYWGIENE